jgi:CTP:molybdopterin cytidylyltransferase MocA
MASSSHHETRNGKSMASVSRFPLIIAAAGKSVRYGRPKLLEVIPGKQVTLIEHVVCECAAGGAGPIVVVLGPAAVEPFGEIGEIARKHGAYVLNVDPAPAQMRDSIEHGIRLLEHDIEIKGKSGPPLHIGFMPADLPGLQAVFVRRFIQECESSQGVLVRALTPEGRGLHPVAIRWADRSALLDLPGEYGPNRLWQMTELSRHEFVHEVEGIRYDLDIPQDWEKFPFLRDPQGE